MAGVPNCMSHQPKEFLKSDGKDLLAANR
jgi:hypothetical protein